MIGYKTCIAFVIGLLVSTTILKASDGVKITSKTKNLASGSVSTTNLYLTEDKVLLENKGSRNNHVVIFDAAKETFAFIDHSKKEYYSFDKQTMKQLKEQIKMMAMMMRQFASKMSESQKKKLDQITNPNGGPAMEFRASNGTEKIKKWKTTKYEAYVEDTKQTEMYIASFKSVGIAKEQFKVMETMINYFNENLKEITALLPSGGSFSQIGLDDSSPVFKEGIPVKTVSFRDNKPSDENIVESITEDNISDDVFKIPAGYQQKEINMQSQMGR